VAAASSWPCLDPTRTTSAKACTPRHEISDSRPSCLLPSTAHGRTTAYPRQCRATKGETRVVSSQGRVFLALWQHGGSERDGPAPGVGSGGMQGAQREGVGRRSPQGRANLGEGVRLTWRKG